MTQLYAHNGGDGVCVGAYVHLVYSTLSNLRKGTSALHHGFAVL